MFAPLLVALAVTCQRGEPEDLPPRTTAATPAAPRPAPAKPIGTWTRDTGDFRITLTFTEHRLTGTGTYESEEDGGPVRLTLDADYSVSPDGVVYGVLTGVDGIPVDATADLQPLAGHPFAFRCRAEGGVLGVSEVKFLGSGLPLGMKDDAPLAPVVDATLLLGGRYQADDGSKKPLPRKKEPVRPRVVPPAERSLTLGGPIGTGAGQPIGVPGPAAPCQAGGACPPPVALPGYPQPPLPEGGVLPAAVQPAALGVVQGLPPLQMIPVPPAVAWGGTWVRERAGTRVVLKVTDKRVNADVTIACKGQDETTVFRCTVRLEADFAVTPDRLTFGVVSGMDFDPPDDATGELAEAVAGMAAVARKVGGQMFQCRVRAEGGELIVRDLKLPGVDGDAADDLAACLTGRYQRAGDKPFPPVKPGPIGSTFRARKPFGTAAEPPGPARKPPSPYGPPEPSPPYTAAPSTVR